MMKKMKKPVAIVLGASLLVSSIGPLAAQAQTPETKYVENSVTLATTNNELAKAIKEENVSYNELMQYKFFVKSQTTQTGVVTSEWKLAAARKAVKFMVDHADVIPVKSVRGPVKKYGGKINNAIDDLEAWSWWGLTHAFMKVGIPEKYADLIADYIVKYVL